MFGAVAHVAQVERKPMAQILLNGEVIGLRVFHLRCWIEYPAGKR